MKRSYPPHPPLDQIRWTDNVAPVDAETESAVLAAYQNVQIVNDLDTKRRQRLTKTQLAIFIASGYTFGRIAEVTRCPKSHVMGTYNSFSGLVSCANLRDIGRSVPANELPQRVRAILESRGAVRRREAAA